MDSYEATEGVIELKLSMVTDENFPILQKFLKNASVRIPNIYVNQEKLDQIRELAGAKDGDKNESFEGSEIEWDSALSNKNVNVQRMIDLLLDIPKETPKNAKAGKRVKALRKLKTLILSYMASTNHSAKFLLEQLSSSFEVDPNSSYLGSIEKEKFMKKEEEQSVEDFANIVFADPKGTYIIPIAYFLLSSSSNPPFLQK